MRRIPLSCFALLAMAVPAVGVEGQVQDQVPVQSPVQAQTPGGAAATDGPQGSVSAEQAAVPEEPAAAASGESHPGVSQVRIVRLSEARGAVQLDRNTGAKFEQAFPNIPIVAGERLQTGQGLAEVEFEDNSTLRLGPDALVEFPVLGRDASGATISRIKLVSGTAYLSIAESKAANVYTLGVGSRTVTLPAGSHIRVEMAGAGATATVAVLGGSVQVADGAGSTLVVPKKKSVTLDPGASAPPVLLAYKAEETPLDKWDKNSASYHQVRAGSAFAGASPYAYGLNDLSYYGSFANYGSCGSLWRPYMVSSGWDPYGSGVWTMYPGAGYSWVSLYPWGWTPYHSGSWQYCASGVGGGGGWGWRPGVGNSWLALNNHPPVRRIGGPLRPLPPLPRPGGGTLVPVNMKALPVSGVGADGGFTFRRDSAGMGVPRGSFGNLGKISATVVERGTAVTPISDRVAQRGMIGANPSGNVAGGGVRPGVAAGPGGAGAARTSMGHGPSVSGGTSMGSMHSAPASSGPSAGASPAGGGSHH